MLRIYSHPQIARVLAVALAVASSFYPIGGIQAAGSDSRIVVVALNRDVYLSRELDMLEEEVEEAANSQRNSIDISGSSDGGSIVVTVRYLAHDGQFAEVIEKRFSNRPGFSVTKTPAKTIHISYSPDALKAYTQDQLTRDSDALDQFVNSLRTPLPGVFIEAQSDGATVRSSDPSFADTMKRVLGGSFDVTPLTKTSWHVSPNVELRRYMAPAKILALTKLTEPMLHQLLGDPLDAQIQKTETGVDVTILNPDSHVAFLDNIERAFSGNADFNMKQSASMILHIEVENELRQENLGPSSTSTTQILRPDSLFWNAMDEITQLTYPSIEVSKNGNAVSLRAKDPSHNADRAAIVRQVFSTRNDLVVATQPDQSLLISIAAGSHIGPPVPALQPEQLADAVRKRTSRLKLAPVHVSALDAEHVRIKFASGADSRLFQSSIVNPSGVTIREVDQSIPEGTTTSPPASPYDQKFSLPSGAVIWVKPEMIVTGDMLADAAVGESSYTKSPVVELDLTDEGRARLAVATREHVGERLAIIVDGVALEAPVIREPIIGGKFEISGNFTADSANALVQAILPYRGDLPLKIIANSVGDAIR